VVGPFVLPDARPSSKQNAPRGKETRSSKFVLRKRQNEVLPAVKPLCSPASGALDPLAYDRSSAALVFPISTPMKGQTTVPASDQFQNRERAAHHCARSYHFVVPRGEQKGQNLPVKYWELVADKLTKAGWSLSWVSAVDFEGRTIWIVDAHRDNGTAGKWQLSDGYAPKL
jgi:hypothetical protein